MASSDDNINSDPECSRNVHTSNYSHPEHPTYSLPPPSFAPHFYGQTPIPNHPFLYAPSFAGHDYPTANPVHYLPPPIPSNPTLSNPTSQPAQSTESRKRKKNPKPSHPAQGSKRKKENIPPIGDSTPPAPGVGPPRVSPTSPIATAPARHFGSVLRQPSDAASSKDASDVWWFVAPISQREKPDALPQFGPRARQKPIADYIVCRECVA